MEMRQAISESIKTHNSCSLAGNAAREHLGFYTVYRWIAGEHVIDVIPKYLSIDGVECTVTHNHIRDIFTITRKI